MLTMCGCSISYLTDTNDYGSIALSQRTNDSFFVNSKYYTRNARGTIKDLKGIKFDSLKSFIYGSSKFDFFLESHFSNCSEFSSNLDSVIENFKYKSLLDRKGFYINVRIFFLPKTTFEIETEHKISDSKIDLYFPLSDCSELAKTMESAYLVSQHEAVHAYFISKGLFDKLTVEDHEFWAMKVSICSRIIDPGYKQKIFITNFDYDPVSVDYDSGNHFDMDPYKRFHKQVISILENHSTLPETHYVEINKTTPGISEIKKWCTKIPY